jgi:hypothetical protein
MHPAIGIALAIADISVPFAVGVVVLVVILRGSDETCERVFRLLRWIANRPEPSPPCEHSASLLPPFTGGLSIAVPRGVLSQTGDCETSRKRPPRRTFPVSELV